jgi:hypothetical protein
MAGRRSIENREKIARARAQRAERKEREAKRDASGRGANLGMMFGGLLGGLIGWGVEADLPWSLERGLPLAFGLCGALLARFLMGGRRAVEREALDPIEEPVKPWREPR